MNVLITGGSKGIGLATAVHFARRGGHVFVNYANDDAAGRAALAAVNEAGGIGHLIKADVGVSEDVARLARTVSSATDHLDLIFHCALATVQGKALDVPMADWNRAVQVSTLAIVDIVRECLPLLRHGSTVLGISSKGATHAVPNYAAVGAPKAFTESLIRYLAVELAPRGIRANVIAAGPVDTEAFRSMFPDGVAEQRLAAAAKANPSGRGLEIADIVSVIDFLAGPGAQMLQGRVIFVDGGLYLQ